MEKGEQEKVLCLLSLLILVFTLFGSYLSIVEQWLFSFH